MDEFVELERRVVELAGYLRENKINFVILVEGKEIKGQISVSSASKLKHLSRIAKDLFSKRRN